jgi:hypothetical protein
MLTISYVQTRTAQTRMNIDAAQNQTSAAHCLALLVSFPNPMLITSNATTGDVVIRTEIPAATLSHTVAKWLSLRQAGS